MKEYTEVERDVLIPYLRDQARALRKTALTMIYTAQSGHPGGSFSAAEIMACLYFSEMRIDPSDPKKSDRDRFVLSKGHVCPILYASLILKGFMDSGEVYNLRKYGSVLQGHPDMKKTPGVDISTGSLGQGISTAVGMAIGLQRDRSPARVFTLVGDGESQEGQVWEAVETAVKYQLGNLIIFLDNNRIQNDGFCEEIMPIHDIRAKFAAFGCETYDVNGHDVGELIDTLADIREKGSALPKVIVARTTKGKGVSYMEDVPAWHGMAPDEELFHQAMKEIEENEII